MKRAEANKSEIRGLIVHAMSAINPDYELIAQTAQDYGINTLVSELMAMLRFLRYPTIYAYLYNNPPSEFFLEDAIAATHARGMKLYISANVLNSPDLADGDEYKVVKSNGDFGDWGCPTKQVVRTLLRNITEEVVTNYPGIDGWMFDYIRYATGDMCYCPECKAKFEEYLGEIIPASNWAPNPSDFAPEGSRYKEFKEWRIYPIDDLIRDMRSWMLAIKPDLEVCAAVWGWAATAPTYNREWIGQDSAYWVKEGWLDWVAPMLYRKTLEQIRDMIADYHEHMVAGPEGKIPLVPILTNCWPDVKDPTTFKAEIDTARAAGADGWVIWRYGGPGDGAGSGAPDIRNYLDIIDLFPTFSLSYIHASPTRNTCTITWLTDLPATSRVEYSMSPLFVATKKHLVSHNFDYWDPDHIPGTIVEDDAPVTSHVITLSGLTPNTKYYYRIQSEGSGIATSKVDIFQTEAGPTSIITGIVSDAETGNPIEDATVRAGPYSELTGADGVYILTVDPDVYTVAAEKIGYEPEGAVVDASVAGTYTQNFSLTPTPIPPEIWLSVVGGLFPLLLPVSIIFWNELTRRGLSGGY